MRNNFIPMVQKWFPYDVLAEQVQVNQGFSFSPRFGNQESKHGYMVSIKGMETKLSLPFYKADLIKVLEKYVDDNQAHFQNPQNYFGAWVDDGLLYLDISKHFGDYKAAIDFAKANEQLAVYGLKDGKVLFIDEMEGV